MTKKDAHQQPRVEELFDTLAGSKCFSPLDLAIGYHQIQVHPNDREKTAVRTFSIHIMPFGSLTAPAIFMGLIKIFLSERLYSYCLAYLDDIVIIGLMFNKHLERFDLALRCFKYAKVKLKLSKCLFKQRSVTCLGQIISDKEISIDPVKLKRIQEWPHLQY